MAKQSHCTAQRPTRVIFNPPDMQSAEKISEALGGKQSGDGYLVPCPVPAHEDNNPSCYVSDRDGKVLAYCHAGCPQDDVLDALAARGLDIRHKGNGSATNLTTHNGVAQSPVPETSSIGK